MAVLDHFGLIAPIYDRVFNTGSPKEWLKLMNLPAQSQLLDVGGGTGQAASALQELTALACVADVSLKMLTYARTKKGLTATCAVSEQLPFPTGQFDGIIMVDALHHVADQRQTACEMVRTLKPGGILFIEEPDIQSFYVKIMALLEKLALMRSHFLNSRQIESLFVQLNVQIDVVHSNYAIWIIIKKTS